MSAVHQFRRLGKPARTVRLQVDGTQVDADENDTVASLLLVCGVGAFQNNKASGRPRSAYCMMGVCFECLVTIDGVPDRQACMEQVRNGMSVQTQCRDRP